MVFYIIFFCRRMLPQNAATFSFSELIYFSYFSYVWMEGAAKSAYSTISLLS